MSPERWRQIDELYHAALEREPGRRAGFLAEACRDDEELRREVESLLAQEGVLAPGTLVGVYRIEAALGQGGMGVVYRALDTKLNRPVAVKFLSNEIADATTRRRFQREAQMASSLNHPHILTVYDAGESGGRQYLVTEFVDGGTLKDWARAEKRAWRQIAEILVGVADGLAAAHQAGILHRDIKPANILVAKNGYAKLADFGLAKLEEHPSPDSVTRTQVSQPGIVVGTIPYMSPEQASGQPLDARSDIFSFGVVLYELLAGKRPFAGATDLEVLQTIIHGKAEPLGEQLPAGLRMVVEKSLEKDPAERYQSMREMVVDLRRLTRQSGETATPAAARQRHGWRKGALAAVVVLALLVAGAVVLSRFRQPAVPPRLEYTQLTNFADPVVSPALSPDGRMLTFIRSDETFWGLGEVYVKLLPDGEPVQLTRDGERKVGPAVFSPDGSRIAYTVAGTSWDTWTVPVLGGQPSRMLTNAQGLRWISPGVLFSEWTAEAPRMALFTSTESRADLRRIYLPDDVNGMVHRAYLSPDRKWVLLIEMGMNGWTPCRVIPFDGSSLGQQVGPASAACSDGSWSPDGKWMYLSANTRRGFHIWRQRFPDGVPEQVTSGATEEEGIAFAPDGRSFLTSVGTSQSALWVHDARGERQISSEDYPLLPSFSADLNRLCYLTSRADPYIPYDGKLWVANLETGQRQRLLPDFLIEHYRLSADGNRVVFVRREANQGHVWIATLDGSSAPRRLTAMDSVTSFFGAGGDVFFQGGEGAVKFLYRIQEDGSGLQKVVEEPVKLLYDVSPDGKWLAAWAGGSVVVYPVGGGPPKVICSTCANRDRVLSWSRDGKFLYLHETPMRQTFAIPLQPGQILPSLPASGIRSPGLDAGALPGAQMIKQQRAFPAANPSVYAFARVTTQRNIYRVPVP